MVIDIIRSFAGLVIWAITDKRNQIEGDEVIMANTKKMKKETAERRVISKSDRIIYGMTFAEKVAPKIQSSRNFTEFEKESAAEISRIIGNMVEGWKNSGAPRNSKVKSSRDAYYLRQNRAQKALEAAKSDHPDWEKNEIKRKYIAELQTAFDEAKSDYENWKNNRKPDEINSPVKPPDKAEKKRLLEIADNVMRDKGRRK